MTPESKWFDRDMRTYEIVRIDRDWVYYRRHCDGAEFSCLSGAFLQRFSQIINA